MYLLCLRHFLMQKIVLGYYFYKTQSGSLKVFYKLDVLKNLAKFTGEHCALSLEVWNFVKAETPAQVSFCEFCKIFKNTCFTEHIRTATSENGRIKSNRTVRSQKLKNLIFCTERLTLW